MADQAARRMCRDCPPRRETAALRPRPQSRSRSIRFAARRPGPPVLKDHPSRVPVWPGPDNRERCLAGERRMPIIRAEFLGSPAESADLGPYGWASASDVERAFASSTGGAPDVSVARIPDLSVATVSRHPSGVAPGPIRAFPHGREARDGQENEREEGGE